MLMMARLSRISAIGSGCLGIRNANIAIISRKERRIGTGIRFGRRSNLAFSTAEWRRIDEPAQGSFLIRSWGTVKNETFWGIFGTKH